jgi:hypothetical protein
LLSGASSNTSSTNAAAAAAAMLHGTVEWSQPKSHDRRLLGEGKRDDEKAEKASERRQKQRKLFSVEGSDQQQQGGEPQSLSIYLATDAPMIRQAFAARLTLAVTQLLKEVKHTKQQQQEQELSGWKVEVDYFKASLPPAHFFIWTYPMQDMKEVCVCVR